MNAKLVNSAAGVILAALQQNRTAAGIALALDSAQLLLTSETVRELEELRARVAELEAAPAVVPAAYELATREHLANQLKQVLDQCAKRAARADQPMRRDLIARGMGLLSALHLVEAGSANNTEEDGEFAGYDEDADPAGGFPDEPIPYADPTGFPAETLLARRGFRGGASC